jgi:hypothetical protein
MEGTDDIDPMEFMRGIDADISDPARWPTLSEDRLCQVIGYSILAYAQFRLEQIIPLVIRMYPYVVERVPPERRFTLLQNITDRFSNADMVPDDSNRHHVDALLPFIVYDPDTTIVSTATLDFAVLRGTTAQPGIGFEQAFGMFEDGAVENQPAILIGLIALGDRRFSDRILGLLKTAPPELAQAVSQFNYSFVFAATVDLVCDWLRALLLASPQQDPGASTFGHVAAALHRLGTKAETTGVRDVSRCFPPMSPSASAIEHGRWTRAAYARLLGPQLQALAEEEREPRILPDVMDAWGLQFVNPN